MDDNSLVPLPIADNIATHINNNNQNIPSLINIQQIQPLPSLNPNNNTTSGWIWGSINNSNNDLPTIQPSHDNYLNFLNHNNVLNNISNISALNNSNANNDLISNAYNLIDWDIANNNNNNISTLKYEIVPPLSPIINNNNTNESNDKDLIIGDIDNVTNRFNTNNRNIGWSFGNNIISNNKKINYLELDDYMIALDDKSLNKLTTAQLMQRLKAHNLPYKGLKHELIQRWKNYKLSQ